MKVFNNFFVSEYFFWKILGGFFLFYYQQEILRNIKRSRRQIAGDYSFKMRKNLGDHDDKTGKSATTLRTDSECSLTDAIHARARA